MGHIFITLFVGALAFWAGWQLGRTRFLFRQLRNYSDDSLRSFVKTANWLLEVRQEARGVK